MVGKVGKRPRHTGKNHPVERTEPHEKQNQKPGQHSRAISFHISTGKDGQHERKIDFQSNIYK